MLKTLGAIAKKNLVARTTGRLDLMFMHLETHTYFQPQHISSLFSRKK